MGLEGEGVPKAPTSILIWYVLLWVKNRSPSEDLRRPRMDISGGCLRLLPLPFNPFEKSSRLAISYKIRGR